MAHPLMIAEDRLAAARSELDPAVRHSCIILDAVADVLDADPRMRPDEAVNAALRLAALAVVMAERFALPPPPQGAPVLKPWVISRANHAPTPLQGWRIYFQSITVPNGKLVETQDARQAATFTEEADATAVAEVIELTTLHTTRWDVVRQP